VTAIGDGCDANQQVSLELGGKQVGSTVADEHGHFSAPLDVGDTGVGDYDVIARCGPTLMTRLAVSQTERSDQPVTTLLLLSFFVVGAMVLFHRSLGLG
jgi:hypothetical protein